MYSLIVWVIEFWSVVVQNTVGTPNNMTVWVQRIPTHAIWKPVVAEKHPRIHDTNLNPNFL